ncbi:ABC transporter ATP-binding protein/permease [bacterium]|nr:ABC transporter ATP-binding protein/permease [bacterium]MDC0422437.1 ABC transporter ATP-binding protein/permease [Hellea sp.]
MVKLTSNKDDYHLISRLWTNYIWPQKRRLLFALLFMALLAATTAAYTFIVSFVIDEANSLTKKNDTIKQAQSYAFSVLPLLIFITATSGLSNYLQRILNNSIALKAVTKMQKQMLKSTYNSDFGSFKQKKSGDIISKFTNDITVVSNALIRTMSNLIAALLTIALTIAAMLYQNWQLSLIMTVFIIAYWPILSISKRMRGDAKNVQDQIGKITSNLKESFNNMRIVKTYNLEILENSRLSKNFDARERLQMKLVTEQARVDPILEVLGGLAIAGVVIFGVYQISNETASAGSIAAVLTGLLILSPKLRALGTLNNVAQEGLAALTRIFTVIDEEANIQDTPHSQELIKINGEISFDNVYFKYPDGNLALKGVSLIARPGETVAIVGYSGSGKSTIMNLIPRLYDVQSGSICIDGHDIKNIKIKNLRNNIALVSQEIILFNTTIANNLSYGNDSADMDDIIHAAKQADAHKFISELPFGYETVLGENGHGLSGGQKQRLSIARALLRDAPILLMDEATSAIDSLSEDTIQKSLKDFIINKTTIIISHRPNSVKNADRIYVLANGNIVETGRHKDLIKKRSGVYSKLQN